jgi:gas vesicle protein
MRFIIGLLLGLGVGFVGALLLAPEKRERREGAPPSEEPIGEEAFAGNHDTLAGLRRAMRGLQEQMQEAWEEAREAAQEAEEEMRARYRRTVPKKGRE